MWQALLSQPEHSRKLEQGALIISRMLDRSCNLQHVYEKIDSIAMEIK